MRIKHFAGYGCVDAKVVFRKTNTSTHTKQVVVEVKGNHEYGLDRSDYKYDVVRWLGKVIKDNDLTDKYSTKIEFQYLPDVREDNRDVERAQYTITYEY